MQVYLKEQVVSSLQAAEFSLHVEPLIPPLRRYARKMVRNRELADDLVQDCLERVVLHWSQHRSEASVRSWIFAIAHNLAVNQIRHQANGGPQVDIDEIDAASLPQTDGHEARLRHRELVRALQELPSHQRAAVEQVCIEGLTCAEAASALAVPVGTVVSRVSRARARLRQALA